MTGQRYDSQMASHFCQSPEFAHQWKLYIDARLTAENLLPVPGNKGRCFDTAVPNDDPADQCSLNDFLFQEIDQQCRN